MTESCDVLVAGAGPAGMAAAVAAAEAGARVLMIDDNPSPGGQIWRGYAGHSHGQPRGAAFRKLAQRMAQSSVAVAAGSRIVAQPAAHTMRLESESGWRDVQYKSLILATGARELFLPFPGWTLPGVLGAGGLQALVKSGLPIEGKRVVLAGSGPLLLAVAASLTKRGARVMGIFEQAPFSCLLRFGFGLAAHPGKITEGLAYRAITRSAPYCTSAWVVRASGDNRLRSVTVSVRGKLKEIACDYLGCGFHLTPNLELPRMLGCRVERGYVAVDIQQWTSMEGIFAAGELTGIGGLDKALLEGEIAGLAVMGKSTAHLHSRRDRHARFAAALSQAFAPRPELRSLAEDLTFICRCEDVPHGALADWRTWRDAKLHTRCGMGPCQGRICGPATAFLYGWENDSVRPPLTPARIETMMATEQIQSE